MAWFAGFRSRERDINSDIARIKPLLDVVQSALRDAEKELDGLRARTPEDGEAATRGTNRARYLREEVEALDRVKLLLGGIIKPEFNGATA